MRTAEHPLAVLLSSVEVQREDERMGTLGLLATDFTDHPDPITSLWPRFRVLQ